MAKRFYDMAAETNADAHLPVSIVLFKLNLELFWEKLRSAFLSPTSPPSPSSSTADADQTATTVDFDSSWDLYLIAVLLGLIGAMYTMRRQRAAQLRRQPPVNPMQ